MSISKQFGLLLTVTFALVAIFAVRLTVGFGEYSEEGSELTQTLKTTLTLNQELRGLIKEQTSLIHDQFRELDPEFSPKFNDINSRVASQQTKYLNLKIVQQERKAVENIRELQAELSAQASQIYELLAVQRYEQAERRLKDVGTLQDKIVNQFDELNDLQLKRLGEVLTRINKSLSDNYAALFVFGGSLALALIGFGVLIRRKVLTPLNSIVEASDHIRYGDFSARAHVEHNDEIGRLAQAFNYMAESLAESYSSLERKVEDRSRQLEELQQQFIQTAKMSAMGRLVSGAAHELNNPLTVILGYTELTKAKLQAENGDPARIKLMEEIHFQADRCRKIVANLLQFARQGKPDLEVVSINRLIDRVLQLREYELRTRNVNLVREFDPSEPLLCADPNKIQQVVLNLLNNASDAIFESRQDGTIWVRTLAGDGKVTFEVLDNGTGIAEPERVFDPFYTTKQVGHGTGLGLSVCYGIVEEHKGEIRAGNWEAGARFVVTLPAGNPADLRPAERPADIIASNGDFKALIVDDEESLVDLQISFLNAMGMEGIGVCTGEEAINFLQKNRVDVIISDVRMPGSIDGIRLYHWVKLNRPELQNKFLFVSGDLIGMNTGRFLIDTAAPRIQKPFQFDSYSRAVRQVLAG